MSPVPSMLSAGAWQLGWLAALAALLAPLWVAMGLRRQ
jgi:hypothetical protein